MKGRNLHTPIGSFTCPSGLMEAEEEGVSIFSGDIPRGAIIVRQDEILADVWDQRGSHFLETFQVVTPKNRVKLQEKIHTLPKGGKTTQYTITIPRSIVETLGWRKMERIWADLDDKKEMIRLTRKDQREEEQANNAGTPSCGLISKGEQGLSCYGNDEGNCAGCRA